MYVEVKGDKQSDLERALQQFVKQVKKAELMEDLKKKEFYLKKSKRLQKKSLYSDHIIGKRILVHCCSYSLTIIILL